MNVYDIERRNFALYDAYIATRRRASERLTPGSDSLCNACWLMWHALSVRTINGGF